MAVDSLAVAVLGFQPRRRVYEEAGHCYEAWQIREQCLLANRCHKSFYGKDDSGDESEEEVIRLELFDEDNEKYMKYLLKLDSNDAKEQDHYKVLGLSKLRFDATMAEIRIAYRQKVLNHHPDKKKAKGIAIESEEYFACITKAYEQLGMSHQKRRAYDSVDNKFDESVPSQSSVTPENFYDVLAPVFKRNSRWSNKKPVPQLGTADSAREDVESFYEFWFDFNSWREFSYLDEEDTKKGEDRWERREMEKLNKVERERRRKAESKRIRSLVEMAYAKDPRIAQFKKEDQAAKERVKEEKQRVQRQKKEEEERARREREEEAQHKEEQERQRLALQREEEKKRKQEAKKVATQHKKKLKKLAEEANYWENDGDKLEEIERIERLCLLLSSDELAALCTAIESQRSSADARRVCIETEISKTKTEQKKDESLTGKENQERKTLWTAEENTLLIKATNLFPAGTVERWQVVADYLNEHRKDKSSRPKTEKESIKQAKLLQTMGSKAMEAAESMQNGEKPTQANGMEWSSAEQKRLESALREFPATDPLRWEKIAEFVGGERSKKDCIKRFKQLAEMIKKSKAAQL